MIRDEDVGPDATLPDSSTICSYLEGKYPQPALYPDDPFDRARAQWYEEFSDTALSETIGAPYFFALVVGPLKGQEPNQEAADNAEQYLQPPRFAYLDKELAGREFLVGDGFSIADAAVASQLVNFKYAGGSLDERQYPNLAPYIARMHARPSIAALITAGQTFLDKARAAAG